MGGSKGATPRRGTYSPSPQKEGGLMDGYILDAQLGRSLIPERRVRCIMDLDDDSIFVAFSDLAAHEVKGLAAMVRGSVATVEPIPDYPPSWPVPPCGLKHKRSRAHAVIVRYLEWDAAAYALMAVDPDVVGVSWTSMGLLVEYGSISSEPWPLPLAGYLWARRAVAIRDVRDLVPA